MKKLYVIEWKQVGVPRWYRDTQYFPRKRDAEAYVRKWMVHGEVCRIVSYVREGAEEVRR